MSREAQFQDLLKRLFEDTALRYRFDGLEVSRVERDYPIGPKKADIVLLLRGQDPFLIVETKRKIERAGSWRVRRLFDPLDHSVVGQALSYAAIYEDMYKQRVPFFGTANPDRIAIFRTPENLAGFVNLGAAYSGEYDRVILAGKYPELIRDYLILSEELILSEDYIHGLLDKLAKDFLGKSVMKAAPTWALIGYFRSFVNNLARSCEPLLKLKIERDSALKAELDKMKSETGAAPDPESLTKMMVYVLMNKIIFYKVLEEKYRVRRLTALPTSSAGEFQRALNEYFDEAISVTHDFEPIFRTGIYDMLPIPDNPEVMEYVNDFIATVDSIRVVELAGLAGYIYEELIPAEERHRLGQFYTPPAICELINRWAIRGESDVVLDPGCGSGGFLLSAYRILAELKTGRSILPTPKEVHERILKQLYAVDINPFPAHLSAVNLSMMNVRAPSTEMRILVDDFFYAEPGKTYFAKIKTPEGEITRAITLPKEFDAVVGNPPYTRWTEIPESTQDKILALYRDVMRDYGLTPQVQRGIEPGIYTYWIIHATNFLKESGRLGMIISDSWLQTDYGIGFGRFLLDNYKVHAVIDISARMFRIPLIGTCIVLAERCSNKKERDGNRVALMYLDITGEGIDVNDVLMVAEKIKASGGIRQSGEIKGARYIVSVYEQQELSRKQGKWLIHLFGLEDLLKKIESKCVRLSSYFEPSYGNIYYIYLASRGEVRGVRNVGGESFFYLTEDSAKRYGLPEEYLYPLLPSARYVSTFTFTKNDWESIRKGGSECYLFLAHKPRDELPESVKKYIELGELDPEKGGIGLRPKPGEKPKPVCQSQASLARLKHKDIFFDWYDLGGVLQTPIFIARGVRYWVRFILPEMDVALDDRILALIPKKDMNLSDIEVKALMACLNSSFTQIQVEALGRTAGGVALLELDVKPLSELLIPDLKSLGSDHVNSLAELFDKLESSAKKLGGADSPVSVFGTDLAADLLRLNKDSLKGEISGLWNTTIKEIDYAIAEALGFDKSFVDEVRQLIPMLAGRRLSRAGEARPEALKGGEEIKVKPPKKVTKTKRKSPQVMLDAFF